jgi:hypothetical protein
MSVAIMHRFGEIDRGGRVNGVRALAGLYSNIGGWDWNRDGYLLR